MDKKLIPLIGITCLFADLIYEGYRSILYILVKTAGGGLTQLCTIWGIGDLSLLIGRIVGALLTTIGEAVILYLLGYILTTILPLSVYIPRLDTLYITYLAERTGKGLRGPARDVIISAISRNVGRAFGIVEALDQVGAVAGPLLLLTLLTVLRNVELFLKVCFIVLLSASILLLISVSIVSIRIRDICKGLRKRLSLKVGKRGVLYFIGTILISSCLFPIVGIQYISSVHGKISIGLEMFTIAMVVSTILALGIGEVSSRKISIILTLALPIASIVGVLYTSNIYAIGILYGIALAVSEVLLRGLASRVGDIGIYAIVSLALCVGTFISSILFPALYSMGIIPIIVYVSTMYATGIALTLSSLI